MRAPKTAILADLCAGEGLQPGLGPPQDQGVDVVGPFIGIHGFQVHDVADDVEFV